jgi:hypothetical protein
MFPLAAALLVVIRTYDAFGVPARELEIAQAIAADTLRAAGVEALWTVCEADADAADRMPERCRALPDPTEVMVRIVGEHESPTGATVLGNALVDKRARRGVLATLFAARVAKMADQAGIDRGTLLGRALAHELGHLLLGTSDHRPSGLMRAHWTLEELRHAIPYDWKFSRRDADEMRWRLRQFLQAGRDSRLTALSLAQN